MSISVSLPGLAVCFCMLVNVTFAQYFLSQTISPGAGVIAAAISLDNTKAAVTAGTSVYIYSISVSGLTLNQTISGIPNTMPELTFSRDATWLFVGANDYKARIYRNSGSGSFSLFQTLSEALGSVGSLAINGDSTVLVCASSDYKLRIYRRNDNGTTQFSLFQTFSDSINSLMGTDISSDATVIAAGGYDNILRVYRYNGTRYALNQTFRQATDVVYTVSMSLDGTLIAACSLDTNVRLYRLNATSNTFYLAQTIKDVAQVVGVRISPDKNSIVFAGTGSYISVYELTSGIYTVQQKLSISATTQYCMGWQSDHSMFITGGADGRIRVYELCSKYFDNCPNCTNKNYCGCPANSYINAAGTCVNCTTNCASCNSTRCLTCNTAYYLDTYDYSCGSCATAMGTGCIACTGGDYYYDNCTAVSAGYYISYGWAYSCPTGCSACTSSSVCTNCSNGYILAGTRCSVSTCTNASLANCSSCSNGVCAQCFTGYYVSSGACSSCSAVLTHCSACSNSSSCTTCDTGYILTGSTCGVCTDTLGPACLSCSSSSVCTACNSTSGYILSSSRCVCKSSFYTNAAGTCTACSAAMDSCYTCSSSTVCLTCPSNKYTMAANNSSCTLCYSALSNCIECSSLSVCTLCDSSYFLDPSTNTCSACSVECGDCQNTATNCTVCAYGYIRSGSVCQLCNVTLSNCDTCTSTTACSSCSSGYIYNSSTTACDHCSNYMTSCTRCLSTTECTACEVGTYLDFTGVCISCPTGCTECISSTNCTACDAAYNMSGTLCIDASAAPTPDPAPTPDVIPTPDPTPVTQGSMTLASITKSPSSNAVTCVLVLSPTNSILSSQATSAGIAQYLQVGPANLSVTPVYSYNNATGELTVVLNYNSSIQDENISVNFNDPSNNMVSSSYFICDPENNLAAVVVDDSTYSSLNGISLFAMIIGYLAVGGMGFSLFTNKFIGIEMIGVFQIAFLGLMCINQLPPLLQPLKAVGISNGPNNFLSSDKSSWVSDKVPKRISALGFQATFLYSFNYIFLGLFSPLITALVFFLVAKLWKAQQAQLMKVVWLALCPFLLTAVLFCIYQCSSASAIFLAYGSGSISSTKLIASDAAGIGIVLAVAGVSMALYCNKSLADKFQEYKSGFKSDGVSQHMYVLLALIRIIECFCLILTKDSIIGVIVAAVLPLGVITLLIVKRPYIHVYNTVRACFNQAVVSATLLSYTYYKATPVAQRGSLATVMPIIEVTVLTVVFAVNVVCMVKSCLDSKKQQSEQASNQAAKEQEEFRLNKEAIRKHMMNKGPMQLANNQRVINNATRLRQETLDSSRDNFLNDISKMRMNKTYREQDMEFYNQI